MSDTTDRPVYVISIAAQLAGMHPQTLRAYDRLGIVSPGRATGRGRRYSERDVHRLREVARMSHEEGINLAGIKRIIALQDEAAALRDEVTALRDEVAALRQALADAQADVERRAAEVHASYRRELVPFTGSAVVVWRPGRR